MFRQKTILTTAFALVLIAGMCASVSAPIQAANLTIGLKGSTTSMDPHYMTSPSNWMINTHIFEPLVRRGADSQIEPCLAVSWKNIDDTTWEFKLRPNVKFSDGSPFTADDVVFTYDRAPNVPNAPTSFRTYTRSFKKVEALDPLTIRITTKDPAPLLLDDVAYLLIVSRKAGTGATTEDYNSGKALVGTGAYTFVSYRPNDAVELQANPLYWGGKEPWDKVTLRAITNDSARLAALMAGDLDLIETVTPQDAERLKRDDRFKVMSKPSFRISWLNMDVGNDVLTKGVQRFSDLQGQPLKENPFADKRVREALKLSVDLDAIVRVIYKGEAVATGQYVLPGGAGYNPELKPWKADPERAKALLTEAGWYNKFKLTITTYEASFPDAGKVAEAVAQSFTRIGIPSSVEISPYALWYKMALGKEFALSVSSYANSTGAVDQIANVHLHSHTPNGLGNANRTGFVDPQLNKLIEDASRTLDFAAREKMLQEAQRLSVNNAVFTPLIFNSETVALKKGLSFVQRADRHIYAMNIRPTEPSR